MDNYDIFKIVEEVEKQRSMNIDDIFTILDSVKDDKDTSTVEEKPQQHEYKSEAPSAKLIKKPTVPEQFGDYDTRFDAFKGIVEHVSYGDSSNSEYVDGHKVALQKYYQDAYNNSKDLYVTEARVNDEINKYGSRTLLYEKGYYDGMFYILKAIKKSKELLMSKLNKEINLKL